MKHFTKPLLFGALMMHVMPANASSLLAPTCAALSGGTASVTTSYAKIELRGFAAGTSTLQIWVQPLGIGCASNADAKGTSSAIATQTAGLKSITPYPGCGYSSPAWGYAAVDRSGTTQSDGSTYYIGRVPILANESKYSSDPKLNCLNCYQSNHYDYRLITDKNGDFTQFCVANVVGNFDTGDSSFWSR